MRFRRIIGTACAAATLIVTGMVTAGPASATITSISPACGATVTASPGDTVNVFTTNLQNCPADGLRIIGNGFTIQINGTISAANGPGDNAGLSLQNATNVRIRNGTIKGFDAGALIVNGSGNILQVMTLVDNINDGLDDSCDLGDGVYISNSSDNQVLNSNIKHNGPFSGVSFVNNSDRNMVKVNQILDSNVSNRCAQGLDVGIRFEGPGANFNRAEGNTIERSAFFGIGLFENVAERSPAVPGDPFAFPNACSPANPTPTQPPNADNFIVNNNIRLTSGTSDSDGIGGPAAGLGGACAAIRTTITGNNVAANDGSGILLTATSHDNIVNSNSVTSNGRDGLRVEGPGMRNQFTNVGPSLLDLVSPDQPPFVQCMATPCPAGTQYIVLSGSGSGDVTAPLVPVGPLNVSGASGTVPFDTVASACSPADFANFPKGAVALIQRGFCGRAQKVNNAVAAGASAVVFFNEGSPGRTGILTAGAGVQPIPVVGINYALGQQLYNLTQAGPVTIHVVTNTTNVSVPNGVPGATDNTLNANRGTANALHDGADYNPQCDNNHWTANIFGTVNQTCVKAGNGTGVIS